MIDPMRVDASKLQPLRQALLERSEHHDAEAVACVEQAAASRRRAGALRALVAAISRQADLLAGAAIVDILRQEASTFAREAQLSDSEALRHDAEASRAAAQAETARSEAQALIARR